MLIFFNMRKNTLLYIAILNLFLNKTYASSWTRSNGELFTSLEFSFETNDSNILFKNVNSNYYKNHYLQLYFEYGLLDDFTIGGYLKNYNFYSIYHGEDNSDIYKIDDDFYSNLFLIQNLYRNLYNSISIKYGLYLPIKYSAKSKYLNALDSHIGYEMEISYGVSDKLFDNINYYFEISSAYKLMTHTKYDEISFNSTLGIVRNNSSSFSIQYEYNYYPESLLISNNKFYGYTLQSNNKIKLTNSYKFNDIYSIEFSYSKSFRHGDANAFTLSLVFN